MKQKITKTNIDLIVCSESDQFVWDDELKGFGVKITPKNRRIFIYQYRDHRRKTKRLTLGKVGELTAVQARREAEKLRGKVIESGGNLDNEKVLRGEETSIRDLACTFLDNYVCDLKPLTQTEYSRVFSTYLPTSILRLYPCDLDRAMVSGLRSRMKENPHRFNRTVKVMSKFYNWLYDSGNLSAAYNPFARVRKYKEKSSERFLNHGEVSRFIAEISKRKLEPESSHYPLFALELLLYTGARKSEILSLKWDEVGFETETLNLPDSKTGKKTIYLNEPALKTLRSIPKVIGNPYVIVGNRERAHLTNIRRTWKSVCEAIGVENVRIHDLRHTFASVALQNGVNLQTIGALLGHSDPRTTQRYAHFDNKFVKSENNKTGSALTMGRQVQNG